MKLTVMTVTAMDTFDVIELPDGPDWSVVSAKTEYYGGRWSTLLTITRPATVEDEANAAVVKRHFGGSTHQAGEVR